MCSTTNPTQNNIYAEKKITNSRMERGNNKILMTNHNRLEFEDTMDNTPHITISSQKKEKLKLNEKIYERYPKPTARDDHF
jgi:hypothetical protein